jgi:hypothetical protein
MRREETLESWTARIAVLASNRKVKTKPVERREGKERWTTRLVVLGWNGTNDDDSMILRFLLPVFAFNFLPISIA